MAVSETLCRNVEDARFDLDSVHVEFKVVKLDQRSVHFGLKSVQFDVQMANYIGQTYGSNSANSFFRGTSLRELSEGVITSKLSEL